MLRNRLIGLVLALLLYAISASTATAAPSAFNLIEPGTSAAPGPNVDDPAAVTEIRWQRAGAYGEADEYTFKLTFPDGTVAELGPLTPNHDSDTLDCSTGTCIFRVDGGAVLTQNGAYSWTVVASNEDGDTEAGNAPFYFRVRSDTPGAFDLVGPGSTTAPGPEVTDPSAVTQIQWEESTNADAYTFALTFPDNSVVELPDLNDGDELSCNSGICTLTVQGETILTQDGSYSWTVVASNEDGTTEAGNAPYFFTVNAPDIPGAFDLVGPGSTTASGPEVTDPSAVTEIQWEESANADAYTFALTFPDNSVVELPDLNDGDELSCDSGVCTLTVQGETILTQDGAYSWTVIASNENGTTEAGNAPYFFTVNLPIEPGVFDLVGPADNSVFTDTLPTQTPIQWGQSAAADTYRFVLLKVSTNVNTRVPVGTVVDAGDLNDGQELTCAQGVCTFVVDASVLDDGQYSWTVFSTNEDGTVEAANGPYTFVVDLAGEGRVVNGDFEALDGSKLPDGWKAPEAGKSKVKCNTAIKTVAYNGACALQLRGNTKLSQNVTDVTTAGQTLTLSAWVAGKNARDGGKIRLVIKYTGLPTEKFELNIPASTYAYQPLATSPFSIAGDVAKAKLQIINRGKGGSIYIDDVSLKAQ